jgi:hypothetical protein
VVGRGRRCVQNAQCRQEDGDNFTVTDTATPSIGDFDGANTYFMINVVKKYFYHQDAQGNVVACL